MTKSSIHEQAAFLMATALTKAQINIYPDKKREQFAMFMDYPAAIFAISCILGRYPKFQLVENQIPKRERPRALARFTLEWASDATGFTERRSDWTELTIEAIRLIDTKVV